MVRDDYGFDHPNHRRSVCLPGARFGRLFNDPFRTGAYPRCGLPTDRFACRFSTKPFHILKGQRFIPDIGVDELSRTRIFGEDKFGLPSSMGRLGRSSAVLQIAGKQGVQACPMTFCRWLVVGGAQREGKTVIGVGIDFDLCIHFVGFEIRL